MNTAIETATAPAPVPAGDATAAARKERLFARIERASKFLNLVGFGWIAPLMRIAAGDDAKQQARELWRLLGIPVGAIVLFLLAWGAVAPTIKTSLGTVPGPSEVWSEAMALYDDHKAERAKEQRFYDRQKARNEKKVADDPGAKIEWRGYSGRPTYIDQIVTSLKTVFMGFMLATILAVPLGVGCGLSRTVNAAMNPLIQIFKPVSPLAWLPIVTMVVSAVYVSNDPLFEKSFLNSAITVTLCSLWPTLINTALGVASIDKDLVNVSRVLQLRWPTRIFRMVLPSALPLIFTGLRLSLGVGWMVLIAAEMLAQNPGLGKFVWDEFQNGSSSSLAKIMVAVFTIGIIGFLLDRLMLAIQAMVAHGANR